MAIFNESNPESYRSIYGSLFSEFGEELTIKIHKAYAGRQISFPKKLYTEEYISYYVEKNKAKKPPSVIADNLECTERIIRRHMKETFHWEQGQDITKYRPVYNELYKEFGEKIMKEFYVLYRGHGELDKAQYKVGEYYYAFCKGEGKIDFNLTIEEGISNAISYYEMAANQGNVNAQIDLYEIFYVGEYVEENDKEAFKWVKMAAQQGNAEAECSIAHAYEFGTGVEADYEEAVKWYEKAAEQGCKEAIRELGFAYRTGDLHLCPSDEKSFYYYMEAAKQGDAFSQTRIAEFYMEGEGVRKNQKEAEKWYRKAFISYMTEAMEGDLYSQEQIVELYMEGKGVEKDEQEAAKWYKKVLDYYTEEALKGDGEKQIEWIYIYNGCRRQNSFCRRCLAYERQRGKTSNPGFYRGYWKRRSKGRRR